MLTEDSVVLDDGTELPADLVVYATGFGSMNGWAADLIGQDVADKVGKVWGLGSDTTKDPGPWEGEQRNMWKPTQQENLWFHGGNLHQSRHYSLYLALQLKARYEGIPRRCTGCKSASFELMTAPLLLGLPPIDDGARVLILGNMPSVMSRPRSSITPIHAIRSGGSPVRSSDSMPGRRTRPARRRCARGVAVWDAGCADGKAASTRRSSQTAWWPMTSDVVRRVPDDRAGVLQWRGRREELRRLPRESAARCPRLPSTSPAQTMRYEEKLAAWRVVDHDTGGRRWAHGRADSICAASDSNVASSNGLPTNWIDSGTPSPSSPTDTAAGGRHVEHRLERHPGGHQRQRGDGPSRR